MLINTTEIKQITTSELILHFNIKIPEIQRLLDKTKVNDIINYQLEYYEKYNNFNFVAASPINIHFYNKEYYIIDGQHRFIALKELYETYKHNITFYIQIVTVETIEELKNNNNMINKNTPLPDFSNYTLLDKNISENITNYFQIQYPNIWSSKIRTNRPKIYINNFQEAIAYISNELKEFTEEEIKNIIIDCNNDISKWDQKSFIKITDNMYETAKNNKFYLGLYKSQNEDYIYDWAKTIVENKTGKTIKKNIKKRKKNIPKAIKDQSWNKYIGKEIGETKCICCNNNNINSKTFIAGHIISEKNEGLITVDNILPICNPCNGSMGSTNMDIYIKKYYNQNYNNFKNKNYNNTTKSWFGLI